MCTRQLFREQLECFRYTNTMLFNHNLFFVPYSTLLNQSSDMQSPISTDMHNPFDELNICIKKTHMKKQKNTITEVEVAVSPFFSSFFFPPFSFNSILFFQTLTISLDLFQIQAPSYFRAKKTQNMGSDFLICKLFFSKSFYLYDQPSYKIA